MINIEESENLKWIAAGNTGCTFATFFAKNPEAIGWKFIDYTKWEKDSEKIFPGTLMISLEFPRWASYNTIRKWAIKRGGFYLEDTSEETEGLRVLCKEGVSWVQYFGPDSHVPTRRSPIPMLMFTCRLGPKYYVKVGFNGILHLAHAFLKGVTNKVYDLMWERSYKQVEKKIGHKPGVKEAAKTTFLKDKS